MSDLTQASVTPITPVTIPFPTDLPPAATVLLPEISAKLDQLAVTPPGAAAETQKAVTGALIGQVITAIQAAAANPAIQTAAEGVLAKLPTAWQFWVVLAGSMILTNLGSFSTGRYIAPSVPPPIVAPDVKTPPDLKPPEIKTPTDPKTPPVALAPKQLVIYPLEGMQTASLLTDPALKALGMKVSVAAANKPGSQMEWPPKSGTMVPVPLVILFSFEGHPLDVRAYTGTADMATWAGKVK